MFVTNIRSEVATMLARELTLNEIAHRLGVARSTVGYHADVLRRDQERLAGEQPDRRRNRRTGPAAGSKATRERIRRLLDMGYSRVAIADLLGIARSTVTYHATRLGHGIDDRCSRRYDWSAIREFYEAGHSVAECRSRFGFNRQTWHAAIQRGVITARPARVPLEQLLVAGPRRNRNHLKRRLFDAGVKTPRCEACGLSEWQGLPIPLALHHINGERHDNRLENLQILCANCHGLTDNWAGRNAKRRTPPAAVVTS